MALDLFALRLSSVEPGSVDDLLHVVFTCDFCGDRGQAQIGNRQNNTLGCRNCSREVTQFTNACEYTVSSSGQIGHVGARLRGDVSPNYDPTQKGWFSKGEEHKGWLFLNADVRARDMGTRRFVVAAELVDYDSEVLLSTHQEIYTPNSDDCEWPGDRNSVYVRWDEVPRQYRGKGRVIALDLKIKTEHGDVLCKDRFVHPLWG